MAGSLRDGDFDYETNSEGTIITQYHGGYTENVEVPEKINDIPVISISNTFKYRYVRSVTLPSSLQTIGDGAFQECYYLTNISVPANVSLIGTNAFGNCTNLKTAYIQGNTDLDSDAFSGCSSLRRIYFAYSGTNKITWSEGAFSGCAKLAEVVIPSQVHDLPRIIFSGCSSLTNVDFQGPLESVAIGAFQGCASLTNLILSNSINYVYDPFSGSGLTNLVFKKPIIGVSGFTGMSQLRTIIFEQDADTNSAPYFKDCPQLQSVVFAGGGEIGIVGFPERFSTNCPSLTSVSFAGKVKSLVGLGDCPSLTSVNFYGGLERIEAFAFQSCPQLKFLVLPDDLAYIGDQAFLNCKSLEKLIFLGQLRPTLDAYPFRGCSTNIAVGYPQGAADWTNHAYWYGYQATAFSTNITVTWPSAEPLQIGQKLVEANLTNGSAHYTGTTNTVEGTFSFDEPDFQPPLGNFTTNVVFTPELWYLGEQTNTITVRVLTNKPVVIPETLTATQGWFYQYQVRTSNDPTGFSLVGNPPTNFVKNLQCSSNTGLLTGIPQKVGATNLVIQAVNSENSSGQATLNLNVVRGTPLVYERPTARPIRSGQTLALSTILNGKASNDLGEVPGDFSWLVPDRCPRAGTSTQEVRFTPRDLTLYRSTNVSVSVTTFGITNDPALLSLTNRLAPAEPLSIQANFTATRYEAFGLPPGLKLDTKTGQISGRPAVSANTVTNRYYKATLVAWKGKERYTMTKTFMVVPETASAYLDRVLSMLRPLNNKP